MPGYGPLTLLFTLLTSHTTQYIDINRQYNIYTHMAMHVKEPWTFLADHAVLAELTGYRLQTHDLHSVFTCYVVKTFAAEPKAWLNIPT